MKELNILVVDDHLMILDGIKGAFSALKNEYDVKIQVATDVDSAMRSINFQLAHCPFDIAAIDLAIPPGDKYPAINDGEDLALQVRQKMPSCKIIIHTFRDSRYKLRTVIDNINPEAILVKKETRSRNFLDAFNAFESGDTYFTPTAEAAMRMSPLQIDHFDKKILEHLSKHSKVKDLPGRVPLQLSSIEKRIKRLKEQICESPKAGNDQLIREAKSMGLI